MALLDGYAIRRTLDSGGLMPTCYLMGLYDHLADARDDLYDYLDSGMDGTFEIVQVRMPRTW